MSKKMHTSEDPRRRKLYQVVKEQLFRETVQPLLEAGGEIPPKKTLAERYGVNVGTLDKALQELEVEGYISKRVGIGTFVLPRTASPRTLGVYWPVSRAHATQAGEFTWRLNDFVQQELCDRNRQQRHYADMRLPHLRQTPPQQLAEDISSGRLQGLIVIASAEQEVKWLRRTGIPCVALNYDFGWGTVAFDMFRAGEDGASALAQKGCRTIEFLSVLVHEWTDNPQQRQAVLGANRPIRAGMANALRPLGIPVPEAWLTKEQLPIRMQEQDLSVEEQGYELGKVLLRERHPDGILVYTDVFGSGVGRALAEAGLRPGKDIEVVLLGNRELTFPHTEGVLRFDVSLAEIAHGLVELLEGAQAGKPPQEILLRYRPAAN